MDLLRRLTAPRTTGLLLTGLALLAPDARAQGVIVDQGSFDIHVEGVRVGTESFVIRRAGLGSGDELFASGVITITAPERQEIRPLLKVKPATGEGVEYQVAVTGRDAAEIRVARAPGTRRYVATVRSALGAEDREYQARPETRIIELAVAHHYYFVRGVREGRDIYTLEPRSRRQLVLRAGPTRDEELRLGPNLVSARRVEFSEEDGSRRVVWFDRQGRVLRVEVPALSWVAERTDLVG